MVRSFLTHSLAPRQICNSTTTNNNNTRRKDYSLATAVAMVTWEEPDEVAERKRSHKSRVFDKTYNSQRLSDKNQGLPFRFTFVPFQVFSPASFSLK